jgi:hypothetical protein
MEFISENLTTIILAFIAIIAGIAITVRIRKNKNSNNNNSNKVKQKGNTTGGDMAGRDINK